MKNLLLLILFIPACLAGQVPLDEENQVFTRQWHEEIICISDRNLYLAGDELWFSAFILMNGKIESNQLSDVLYVELINRENKVLASAKYPVQGNQCNGKFSIPAQTSSGAFFLRSYTRYQRNFHPASFGHIPLTVVNTGITLPEARAKAPIESDDSKINKIAVSASKSVYGTREPVSLDVSMPPDFAGWLCVSAVRQGTLMSNQSSVSGVREIQLADDSVFHIPDIRGMSISGFVRDEKNAVSVGGLPVYLSAFGSNRLFHITETGPDGAFLFALKDMYGLSNVFVTIDPGMQSSKQLLINTGFSNQFARLPNHVFSIDSTYNDLLSAMLVDLEARKAFDPGERTQDHDAIMNLPATYDVSVRLDDYIELSSLEEVFYEIVPPVSVKDNSGQKYLAVANYQTQRVSSAGIVLLDNVPIFNINELLKISPVNIDRIDVINRPYYLGDHLLESVVSLRTKTGDFGGYIFPDQSVFLEYQTFEQPEKFRYPDYSEDARHNKPLPDFRTTLFWEPALPAESQTAEITFFTSDARGEYEVVVYGVSEDGEISIGKTMLEVK